MSEAVSQRCSVKKVLEILQNQSLFFNKVAGLRPEAQACKFIKKASLAQVFSCEFCKISQNTFFTEHLGTAASEYIPLQTRIQNFFGSQPFFTSYNFTKILAHLLIIAAVCNFSVYKLIGWDPENIYLFKVNNRNTRKRCEICSNLEIDGRTSFWCLHCYL